MNIFEFLKFSVFVVLGCNLQITGAIGRSKFHHGTTDNPIKCICVPPGRCGDSEIPIKPRLVKECQKGHRCCFDVLPTTTTTAPPEEPECGQSNPIFSHHSNGDTATFGEFPWMVKILGAKGQFLGTGALISENRVLTVAHLFQNEYPKSVIIGEWKSSSSKPYRKSIKIKVSKFEGHDDFNFVNLFNDIAILHLESSVDLQCGNPQIGSICLPSVSHESELGRRCYVSTFGNEDSLPNRLELHIKHGSYCEDKFRAYGLGVNFHFNRDSFLCAGGRSGGASGADTCQGHGGAPLVCEIEGRYELQGLVSWGVTDCNDKDRGKYPGVYLNVFNFSKWIADRL